LLLVAVVAVVALAAVHQTVVAVVEQQEFPERFVTQLLLVVVELKVRVELPIHLEAQQLVHLE
jgi:hypothetical protein